MADVIIKLERDGHSAYLIYNTISSGPSYGMTLDELRASIKEEWGQRGLDLLPPKLERVDRLGTSSPRRSSAEETIRHNECGAHGVALTVDEIWQKFVLEQPDGPPWDRRN